MFSYQRYILVLFVFIYSFWSCTDKLDLNDLGTDSGNGNITGDTVYVQIKPVWDGYNKPQDVMVGREPFIYVADTDNNRIVLLNLDGQILGIRSIIKPVALAQDYRLNLIVCAQFDTVINGQAQIYSAVYKLDLVSVNHQIDLAPVKKILPRPQDFTQPLREYTGACVFFDNTYLISRKGPNNTNLVDPDNVVLIFVQRKLSDGSYKDSLVGRVPLLDPTGSGIMSANQISSLTSYNARNFNINLTLTGDNSFKFQPLEFIISPDFTGYRIALQPESRDLMMAGNFLKPEGNALDNSGNIFIADAEKDSIFKFNSFGDKLLSFGGPGPADTFNQPYGVAFFNKTLYVADTGNNRILRFILSTEL
jgi:DNA-binding beta-propeller fold protein YncE